MVEKCICAKCGRVHRKKVKVDTVARARKAADVRWGKNRGPAPMDAMKEGE